jgi:uncharacterized OB-fold protein
LSGEISPTINNFYELINKKRLMACMCIECGTKFLPPKALCPKCFSKKIIWSDITGFGKLISYTIIHIAPEQFQNMVPYVVGIIEFDKGIRLPGIIRNVRIEEIKVGMKLKIDFDLSTTTEWPQWSKYYFKPV